LGPSLWKKRPRAADFGSDRALFDETNAKSARREPRRGPRVAIPSFKPNTGSRRPEAEGSNQAIDTSPEMGHMTNMKNRQSTAMMALHLVDRGSVDAPDQRPDARTRILNEAERLFRHYGYTKTTIADIARELGMSPANVYRFFASKAALHEALADRMLAEREIAALKIARLPLSAAERLRIFVVESHKATVATMLDQEKVHEMVSVAIDQQWSVIDRHIDRTNGILAMIIKDGIANGEFADRDPEAAARCFSASVVSVWHPQVVAQCMAKTNRATPDELAEFALRALKP